MLIRHGLMTLLRLVILEKVREDRTALQQSSTAPTVDIPTALLMYAHGAHSYSERSRLSAM